MHGTVSICDSFEIFYKRFLPQLLKVILTETVAQSSITTSLAPDHGQSRPTDLDKGGHCIKRFICPLCAL